MTPPDTFRAEDLKNEIAYIRNLAEEGHRPDSAGGSILVTAGLGWGAMSVLQAGAFAGVLPEWPAWLWWVPMPLFVAVVVHVSRSQRRRPGGPSPLNRALQNAWTGIGCAMGAIVVSFIVISAVTGSGAAWGGMPSVFLALYGAGWTLYGVLSKQKWVMVVAIACFFFAPLIALLAQRPVESLLAYAVALLVLVAAPGFVMMRNNRVVTG